MKSRLLVLLVVGMLALSGAVQAVAAPLAACGLTRVAFCHTFDTPRSTRPAIAKAS